MSRRALLFVLLFGLALAASVALAATSMVVLAVDGMT